MFNQPPPHVVLANRYVLFVDNKDVLKRARKELANIGGNMGVGYIYVDHTAGLSMRIHLFAEQDRGGLRYSDDLERPGGSSMILRQDSFADFGIKILDAEGVKMFGLPPEPAYAPVYRNAEVEPLRSLEILHPLRAPGFPDDITFMLLKDTIGEQVWGRLERRLSEEQFECTLLNQPNNDFGVRAGERVIISVNLTPEGIDARFVSKVSSES